MRLLFIAAVLGTLACPALAFTEDDCGMIEFNAHIRYVGIFTQRTEATNLLPNGDYAQATEPDKRRYDLLIRQAAKDLEDATKFAQLYQAFCKD